ncbi:MAG: lactate racemase domain-containing protein [Pyrinomonadaceae bacterium]
MTTVNRLTCGNGSPKADLTNAELRSIVEDALARVPAGARVLAIVSDKTRDDNTPTLFPFAARFLDGKPAALDVLIAQGTHTAMNETEKLEKLGVESRSALPNLGNIYDHRWSDASELTTIGEITAEQVTALTGGLFTDAIPLTINRLLAPGVYDTVLIFGATVPHEVAGFAGGAKYFFPGVSGPELTHATHWLAALATVENIIGLVETPTRHLIEAAADHISAQVISFTTVVSRPTPDRLQTHALFAGDFRTALRKGAEVSRVVHIKYTGRKYRRVVALLDQHYDELWVGGKASYRLGSVIEEGGELIIYAPHLRCISETHGHLIEQFGGYAPLPKVKELVAQSSELQANLCVAAHLSQVAFAGRVDEQGELKFRYAITLASQVDLETCRRVNLDHMDPAEFRLEDYSGDPNTLIVERAGNDLYLVEPGA